MTQNPALKGFLKGLGTCVLIAVLTFIGSSANLSFLSPTVAVIISGFALWLEGIIEGKTGHAMFGLMH